jgi:prepilin-type N-terminal cleavage/methylation domain-containing protein
MKGFSLIEIIFSIAIIGILSVMVVTSFHTAQARKEQQGIVQSIVADLEKQKSDTQAGKAGSQYGVKFNPSNYVLFTGTSYATTSPSNRAVNVDSEFQLSETISNAQNIIYFSKINGNANETATITVSHISNRVNPLLLTVQTSGAISVIE